MGYAKITRDLTERMLAEESLQRSEEQFRLLVQSVTDYAIFMLDVEGHVSSWNAGAERIKGYLPDEIIGEHFSRFYTPEDREADIPGMALETARRTGRYASDGRRVRKDGTEFEASVVIEAVQNDRGELIGFAKITRDISERVLAQQELEVAREALFHSQKMDAVGQLTGGVAHDFNNFLMAITGSLELLRNRLPQDPLMHKLLDNAVLAAGRGALLTQRMLAFARSQQLHVVPVDIPEMVSGMADLLQRSLGSAWTIETRFPLEVSAISADLNQLEMALLNLVVNARDAMPGGGVITIQISERTLREDEVGELVAGQYVGLSITDTGIGMEATTLTRATEPFFTTKDVGKGTGLGLSMVHGIARQLGGALVLKSEPGEGATAEIWLPVAAPGVDDAVAGPVSLPDNAGEPLTIVVVDDEAVILMNTVMMLEEMGHTVFEAGSGEEAIGIVRSKPEIDLVITDYAMPDMNGVQLVEQVISDRPGMPVILATGFSGLTANPDPRFQRLGKPYDGIDLKKAVDKAMGEQRSSRSLGR